MQPPEIREATLDDVPGLLTLVEQLGYEASPGALEERVGQLTEREGEGLWVLVAEGPAEGVKGFAHARETISLTGGFLVELVGLAVHAEHRRQGLGSALVEHTADWARRRGFKTLRVRSQPHRKAALGFYRERGFVEKKVQQVFERGLYEAEG